MIYNNNFVFLGKGHISSARKEGDFIDYVVSYGGDLYLLKQNGRCGTISPSVKLGYGVDGVKVNNGIIFRRDNLEYQNLL